MKPRLDRLVLVDTVPGLRPGASVAFSARGTQGTEELYIIAAVEPGATQPELRRQIEITLHQNLGLTPSQIFFVRPRHIPRTSSGKLKRSACRGLLESGELQRRVYQP